MGWWEPGPVVASVVHVVPLCDRVVFPRGHVRESDHQRMQLDLLQGLLLCHNLNA